MRDGRISGAGEYRDARGNRYVGEFESDEWDGVGMLHHHDTGAAEAWRYQRGAEVGIGVGWSADRREAWRLVASERGGGGGGAPAREPVDLDFADAIAQELGLSTPPPAAGDLR